MTTTYPASPKQTGLITRLLGERDTTGTRFEGHTTAPAGLTGGRNGTASQAITALFALPKKATEGDREHAKPGYYATDAGDFVFVKANKAGTRTYAVALTSRTSETGRTTWSWDYAPGTAATLAAAHPMTVQEAAAFGHLHGICIRCLKALTDPVSATLGYGETCAGHMGWPYPQTKAARQALLGVTEDDDRVWKAAEAAREAAQEAEAYAAKVAAREQAERDWSWAYQNRWGRAENE